MITDKQKQKDFEYDADYKSKCPYTTAQWVNIINGGQLTDLQTDIVKAVYSSYNHAASLPQLAYALQISADEVTTAINEMGKTLASANELGAEVDYDGNEYWWYLCFWGKNLTQVKTIEFKMQPELTEAVGQIWPELEQAYYAFLSDVDRSLQYRYTEEDSVWIAAAVLLYEKYYLYPGITPDDILLMQYEVQTRAQKVFGQDVGANIISQVCNADERGHRLNYLRDIYKYYRVSFPGEFEDDRERPDPEELDYNLYIYSLFGYMTLNQVYDFISHEYAHLVDESYVELNEANGFVRLADFLTRKGGTALDLSDKSDKTLDLIAQGEDAEATFHLLAQALLSEYPNFVYAHKASWYLESEHRIPYIFYDQLYMEDYRANGACISFVTLPEKDSVHIEIALNLPYCNDEEIMLEISEKCSKLTLMTQATFQVETINGESHDLDSESRKIKAFVVYPYEEFLTMKEEDIVGMMAGPMEIFASFYTDICQNYYPTPGRQEEDPLAAALGSKLVYKKAVDTPGPEIIYKEGVSSSATDFVTRAIQGYGIGGGSRRPDPDIMSDGDLEQKSQTREDTEGFRNASGQDMTDSAGFQGSPAGMHGGSGQHQGLPAGFQGSLAGLQGETGKNQGFQTGFQGASRQTQTHQPAQSAVLSGLPLRRTPMTDHPDRYDQGFGLYPKNTLIRGPMKTAKYHEAILTAVGIIEGKEADMVRIEPVPDILEHYKNYVEEGRILQISFPDIRRSGYEGWMESIKGGVLIDGIFKDFANRCGAGRYVVMMEDADLNWAHLFGEATVLLRENRRQGASSETAVTLPESGDMFRLPSNLYIVATCDAAVMEDTILGAIGQDFFIRPVNPEPQVLSNMRIQGISLEKLMTTLNLRISYFLGPEYQLGEGFFLASPQKDPMVSLGRVFREQIIPMLEKWFDGDIERIRYVLGDNGKTDEATIFYREMPFSHKLFKGRIPDYFDTEGMIYEINEKAFFQPRSYIEIYQ